VAVGHGARRGVRLDAAVPRERARSTAPLILAWFSGLRACFHTVRAMPMAAALLMIFMHSLYPAVRRARVTDGQASAQGGPDRGVTRAETRR
jgi:hypothetical protein